MMRRSTVFLTALLVTLATMQGALAAARAESNLPAGASLSPADQRALEALRRDPERLARMREALQRWKALPANERSALREKATRFDALPPERRALLRERYQRWQAFPPAERTRLERNFERYRTLPKSVRKEVRTMAERLEKLAPARRARLLERLQRWRSLPPAERERRMREWRQQRGRR